MNREYDTLASGLVIDGLWEGAPVVMTTSPAAPDHLRGRLGVVRCAHSGGVEALFEMCSVVETVKAEHLSLRLPGPRGLGLAGLKVGVERRTEAWRNGGGRMSGWFLEALGAALIDDAEAEWSSRYLAMTDALADLQGWPTGPGAPVYGWRAGTNDPHSWELVYPDHIFQRYHRRNTPALEGITDPMPALEAAWKGHAR